MIRKPRIRAPKRAAPMDVASVWKAKLGPAVHHILTQSSGALSFDDLYRSCYLLVSQQNGRSLYKAYNDALRQFLVEELAPQLIPDRIAGLAKLWRDFALALSLIGDIFMYLNRGFCEDAKLPYVERSGELLFRDLILVPHTPELYAQINEAIRQERDGHAINTQDLATITQMLASLASGDPKISDSIFNDQLLPLLAENAKDYYRKMLGELFQAPQLDAKTVLWHLREWVDREKKPRLYLPPGTNELLCTTVEQEVLPDALAKSFTFASGLSYWIETNDVACLALAAELESRSGAEDSALVATIGEVIKQSQLEFNQFAMSDFEARGAKAMESIASDWIKNSIGLRNKIQTIYEQIKPFFANDKIPVMSRLDSIWADCTNKLTVKSRRCMAEFLAVYTDQILKKSSSNYQTDDDIERAMDDCITLFTVVVDKDAFSISYGVKLGRRLLQHKSRSEEFERAFLAKLKTSPGHLNTSHFQIMLADMQTSQQLSAQFNAKEELAINTKVNVGRSGIWDNSYTRSKTAVLPPNLEQIRQDFDKFYSARHFRRKLMWNLKLGAADVKIKFGDESYLVTLPLVCLSVLWLFQGEEELSTTQIAAATEIPLDELVPTLQVLSMVKPQRFLVKSSSGREVGPEDTFRFNNEFRSPKKIIRVQLLSSYVRSERTKADTETNALIDQRRVDQIHAAIVRIMKARKTASHSSLMQEVVSVLAAKFPATPSSIKKGISELIDKDYLARDAKDSNMYVYLA